MRYLTAFLIVALLLPGRTFGNKYLQAPPGETEKIEKLISFIGHSDASFIRNGTAYTGKQAADHMRLKLSRAGSAIKTAKDFIDKIASTSSMSGKPYKVQFKNGTELNLRDVLYNELRKISGQGSTSKD
jgi:hypothetical protein